MTRYAQGTEVTVEKSRAEIERTLTRYGATEFAYGWRPGMAMVQFHMEQRAIRFLLPMPDPAEARFTSYKRGYATYERSKDAARSLWEQACRQRWRALALVVKAKLEAVESGISTFEAEFMANILLPDGSTFGEWAVPQIRRVYEQHVMPSMLPELEARP